MISNCKLFINFPKLFRDLLLYVYNDWMLSSLLLLLNGGRHFKALISHSTKLWHKVCFSLLKSQKIVKFWYNKHFHFIAEVLANWTIFLKRISVLGSLLLKQHVLDFLGAIMRCIFFRSFNHQVQDTHKKTYFIEIPTFDFNLDKKYTRSSFSNNPNPHGRGGGCLFDPLYHGSVFYIYRTRTRFTKIHDFVPFGTSHDPKKLFLTFFKKFWNFWCQNSKGGLRALVSLQREWARRVAVADYKCAPFTKLNVTKNPGTLVDWVYSLEEGFWKYIIKFSIIFNSLHYLLASFTIKRPLPTLD